MSQPEIVQNDLADEDVVARVDLGSEDELYVTPTRTLVYRAEGLLSDEAVEAYPHGAERITVSKGRRKAKVTLDYGLDGQKTISLPAKRLERALQPIVEGVFRANGVLSEDESIERLFRFSELTIAIAGERVVRHIGSNLWDEDFESYHYADVTDLDFEDGSVATSVVLTVDGRRERFKTPNEDARAVRSTLETTLLTYWDVDSIEELRAVAQPDADETGAHDDATEPAGRDVSFGDGPDPLIADPTEPENLPENATRGDNSAETAESTDADPAASPPSTDSGVSPGASEPASSGASTDSQPAADSGGAAEQNGTRRSADPLEGRSGETATQGIDQGADAGNNTGYPGGEEATASTEPSPTPTEAAEGQVENDTRGGSAQEPTARDSEAEPVDGGSTSATTEAGAATGSDDTSSVPASGFEGSEFESAAPAADEQVREELAELRAVVERQNEELRTQRELLEQLIEELRLGR